MLVRGSFPLWLLYFYKEYLAWKNDRDIRPRRRAFGVFGLLNLCGLVEKGCFHCDVFLFALCPSFFLRVSMDLLNQ